MTKGGPAPFQTCNTESDCDIPCQSLGAGCCCVGGGTGLGQYCGVPVECNDFLMCIAPPPTPAPTDDNRGFSPGGTVDGIQVDDNGCIAVSQEWCPILNQCVVTATNPCSATPVDADGCAVGHSDGPEVFCESRQDCILDQLWSCPMENPPANQKNPAKTSSSLIKILAPASHVFLIFFLAFRLYVFF